MNSLTFNAEISNEFQPVSWGLMFEEVDTKVVSPLVAKTDALFVKKLKLRFFRCGSLHSTSKGNYTIIVGTFIQVKNAQLNC